MGARRRLNLRRKRPSTKKVYRQLKRRRTSATKYAVAKNTTAIKQLQTVTNQGQVQRNLQRLTFDGVDPDNQLWLQDTNPVFFCANDFTSFRTDNNNGGQLFSGKIVNTAPPGTPPIYGSDFQLFGNWIEFQPGYNFGLSKEWRQWSDVNRDHVSYAGYMPVSARFSFNFNWRQISVDEPPICIRFDILKPKKQFLPSTNANYMLPQCGGVLAGMARTQFDEEKNSYNPELWTVKTFYKWVRKADVDRKDVSKTVNFNIKFPRRYLDLNLESMTPNAREQFWTNCPLKQQVWININISKVQFPLETSSPKMLAQRQIIWRDQLRGPKGG